MAKVIRIDTEVYEWLRAQATPLTDSPNDVLRRVIGLSPANVIKTPIERTSKRSTGRANRPVQ